MHCNIFAMHQKESQPKKTGLVFKPANTDLFCLLKPIKQHYFKALSRTDTKLLAISPINRKQKV